EYSLDRFESLVYTAIGQRCHSLIPIREYPVSRDSENCSDWTPHISRGARPPVFFAGATLGNRRRPTPPQGPKEQAERQFQIPARPVSTFFLWRSKFRAGHERSPGSERAGWRSRAVLLPDAT